MPLLKAGHSLTIWPQFPSLTPHGRRVAVVPFVWRECEEEWAVLRTSAALFLAVGAVYGAIADVILAEAKERDEGDEARQRVDVAMQS